MSIFFSFTRVLSKIVPALVLLIALSAKSNAQSVVITAPTDGSSYTVGAIIPVTATATPTLLGAVNKVVFTLGSVSATSTSSPYSGNLNTSTLTAGVYTLTVTNYYTPFLGTQTTLSTTITINLVSATAAAYGNYAFSKVLALNSSTLGITTNLANFPALVYIQDNALKIGSACADKVQYPNGTNYDFAFTSPGSSVELNYQIEKYDPVAGTLLVWVKMPTLYYDLNTPLYFYFGSKTPPVTHNSAFYGNTWASDYQAVYHFNEGSATATVLDATNNGRNAAQTNTAVATGEITGGYSFNGSTSQIVTTSTSNNITGSFTLSAWVNSTSFTGHTDQKVMTNEYSYSAGGYKLSLYGGSATTVYDEVETRASNGAVSLDRTATGGTAITAGVWHYVQGIYNASNSTFYSYIDGKLDRSLTGAVAAANGQYIYLGSDFTAGNWLYGILDEARISNTAKTSDWIKAEYANQSSPLTFTTAGTLAVTQTNAAAIAGALVYTYKGVTTPYTDPTNWDNTTSGVTNQAPAFDGTATLIIPTGKNLTLNSNAAVYGITLSGTATLTLSGYNLSVGCNIYNQATGKILWNNNNASKITWNGSAATQSYNGSTTTGSAQVGSMEVNNTAGGTITVNNDTLDVYHELRITSGNLAVASGAIMALKSYATQTAYVTAIPTGYSITGAVNVERYLTGGSGYRGYRLLSSPITSGSGFYSVNYLINSSYLSGTAGIPGGFDKAGNPTLYLYRENLAPLYNTFLNSNFRGINTISSSPNYLIDSDPGTFNIPVGNGFLFFFRGDRSATTLAAETTTTYVPTSSTAMTSGTLNQGTVTANDWYTPASSNLGYTTATANTAVRGYNLVGNPYPSAIDWDLFSNTASTAAIYGPSVTPFLYALDPVSKNYGAYLSGSGGTGTNNVTNVIASGQGFFVKATCSCAQLIFNESAKTTAQVTGVQLLMGKPVSQVNNQVIRLKMLKDSVNTDETMMRFSSSYKPIFNASEDAEYKPGQGEVSLASLSSDSVALAINQLPLPDQHPLKVGLAVKANADGSYSFKMGDVTGIPQLYDIWLMDTYQKDSLDMRHNSTYSFNISTRDTASFGNKRFNLVIRQNPAYAYRLLNFTAAKAAGGAAVQIVWKTENEQNYTYFTVERSTDNGNIYEVIGGLTGNGQGTYSLSDNAPLNGTDLYRLKQEDVNASVTYTRPIAIMFTQNNQSLTADSLSVYPNPATDNIHLNIPAGSAVAGSYGITIMSSSGSVILKTSVTGSQWHHNISNLLSGTYFIQVVNEKDQSPVGRIGFVKL